MFEEAGDRLFEVAKAQDQLMHSLSAEMSVKTSLYLVFTAFIFSASIQLINFCKDVPTPCSRTGIALCGTSAAFSLLAGIMLLIAALVRQYNIFATRKMNDWVFGLKEYHAKYPNAETESPSDGVLMELIETVEKNKAENEKKATWITAGACLLFGAVAFLALGGGFALYSYFNRPS
jgi:hypothetical protein